MPLGDLFARLQENDPERLIIGQAEDHQIDFKREPYFLDRDRQKWELAKDVAALANSNGGAIVIGVKAERQPHELAEVARRIHPVPRNRIDFTRYRDVIEGWVCPYPRGIVGRWFPDDAAIPEGLFALEVPAQLDHLKPFAIRRTVTDDGEKVDAIAVPRRDGDRVVFDSVEEIQRQLSERLRGVSQLERPGDTPPGAADQRATTRRDEIVELQGWGNAACYFLQAIPPLGSGPIANFYDEVPPSVLQPQLLRQRGFADRWRVNEERQAGGFSVRHHDGIAWIERDGFTTEGHIVSARSHLGWYYNQNRQPDEPLILHPVAALEVTLEFFRFVQRVLQPRQPGGWRYIVTCRNFLRGAVALPRGHPDIIGVLGGLVRHATADEWSRHLPDAGDATTNAYRTLVEVYALFGWGEAAIPLVLDGQVSEDQLRALG